MIRQAVSCDVCGAEKRQTNHWFVAYEQGGELRLSGWTSRRRLRPESKHLCGQTCLHKFVDDFMAKAIAVRPQAVERGASAAPAAATDASLTSNAVYAEIAAPVRLLASPVPLPLPLPPPATRPHTELAMAERLDAAEITVPLDEPPRYATRNWRAEAWQRERERESRAAERGPGILARNGSRT